MLERGPCARDCCCCQLTAGSTRGRRSARRHADSPMHRAIGSPAFRRWPSEVIASCMCSPGLSCTPCVSRILQALGAQPTGTCHRQCFQTCQSSASRCCDTRARLLPCCNAWTCHIRRDRAPHMSLGTPPPLLCNAVIDNWVWGGGSQVRDRHLLRVHAAAQAGAMPIASAGPAMVSLQRAPAHPSRRQAAQMGQRCRQRGAGGAALWCCHHSVHVPKGVLPRSWHPCLQHKSGEWITLPIS